MLAGSPSATDPGTVGEQTMTGCLQHSLNVCLAGLPPRSVCKISILTWNDLGLVIRQASTSSGEAAGRLKVPGDTDWYPVDLGTNAFGQGVSVTPMQMLMAVSAVANNGRMVTPHVLYPCCGMATSTMFPRNTPASRSVLKRPKH